jgi:hypothetical protein
MTFSVPGIVVKRPAIQMTGDGAMNELTRAYPRDTGGVGVAVSA